MNFSRITKLLFYSFFCVIQLSAQVTIGVGSKPAKGALLDLKQEDNATGGVTSKLGLGLPRMKLTDKDNLFPMFSGNTTYTGAYKVEQDAKHIGLLVYNIDVCSLSGKGMYVWTKNGWEILGNATGGGGGGLSVTPLSLLFYNGLLNNSDYTKKIDVSWTSTSTSAFGMATDKTELNFDVVASQSTSPIVYTVSIPNMTDSELVSNPYLLKTGKITYSLANSPCAATPGGTETKTVDIQQINKALVLNENTIYTNGTTTTGSVNAESNAKWNMGDILPNSNTVKTVVMGGIDLTNSANNVDWEDNTGSAGGSGSITVGIDPTATNPNRYNYVTFSDTENPKRFTDVSLTVLQCASTNNPSMAEWIKMAGLKGSDDEGEPNDNGVAWHYDQDGNQFLSGRFGYWDNTAKSERRWMITNLAAKDFVRTNRTGEDTTINTEWGVTKYNTFTVPSAGTVLSTSPVWCYPGANGSGGTSDAVYSKNPRIGLLYNWQAATNSYSAQYSTKPADVKATALGRFDGYNRRQGICPNGWHLPSYSETIDLLNEIIQNTSTYSNTATTGSSQLSYAALPSSNKLSIPMKDYCSIESTQSLDKLKGVATSNPISANQVPGFNASFCGLGSGGSIVTANSVAYYWLFSVGDFAVNTATAMLFTAGQNPLFLENNKGMELFVSVRCVKDYDTN